MKTVVIYHANCWDGFCAAWIAKNVLQGEIHFIPAQYGQEPPAQAFDRDTRLYVVDFSYPRNVMFKLAAMRHEAMVVLDHHKTAEQALDGLEIELASNNCGDALTVKFDMDKSGGRLAWEHFHNTTADVPWLVSYTEDRDLWRHKLDWSREINAFIRSWPLDFAKWDEFNLIGPGCEKWDTWIDAGSAILRRERQIIDDHIGHAREIEIDGHTILAVNATVLFSDIAGELANERPFGACYFDREDGKRQWSLRSRDGGIDVAEIAKKHGGGGHRNAAGFEEPLRDESSI
jgi:oligoribonuclease NrnB/cAMP/cGMP phosphodiesterase (DHH superfamily)